VSETPRTDAAYSIYDLRKVAQDIERELNAANAIIRQQQLLDEENLRLKERIERLEEAGDAMEAWLRDERLNAVQYTVSKWRKAKEAKP
jgi:hypothetical protein